MYISNSNRRKGKVVSPTMKFLVFLFIWTLDSFKILRSFRVVRRFAPLDRKFKVKMSIENNPFLVDWGTNGLPPFSQIKPEHIEPAFEYAMNQHLEELKRIAIDESPTSFENTIVAFDRSGALHSKIYNCYDNLCMSVGVPELQAVELKMAGPLAAHENKVYTLPGLFAKIDAVHSQRHSLSLNREDLRLVERLHLDFVRAGARFNAEDQVKYARITEELAQLHTQFVQVPIMCSR